MLHTDGRLMTENLRKARATDTYICRGDPEGEAWTPRFTFHGFQFVEVAGLTRKPDPATVTGLVLGSDTPKAGSFECDNPKINQLYSNIVWTQRANFLSIPTDCPQRDERMGWTGDAQIYVSVAPMNMDVAAFYTKWLVDLNDSQWEDGSFPNFSPTPFIRPKMKFSPGWMEAGIICPYHVYRTYGDERLIRRCWPYMEKFMDFHISRAGETYCYPEASFEDVSPKGGFGDWLSFGKKTPPDMLATMYFGHCARLMSEMAGAVGDREAEKKYMGVFEKAKQGFLDHYVDPKGRFKCDEAAYKGGKGYVDGNKGFSGHTQTAYANAIYMDFLPDKLIPVAGNHLRQLIEDNKGLLSTGFLGVKQLLPALSETGQAGLGYKLLLNEECPSWLFEVVNGATSIWERWNSYTKKGGFVAGMNSFSHYSFGAVYEWMFQNMAGIRNADVGYRRIVFRPEISEKFKFVKVTHRSIAGDILAHWEISGNMLTYRVTVPVNSTAEVFVPCKSGTAVTIDGKAPADIRGIKILTHVAGYQVFSTGSGSYTFASTIK